ncbi:MAG TPA: hypothetical protein VMN60_08540 [Longimicrobiales bacterium]|nr:hypothetical protein [Longimicrobiales bacterium]
MIADNRPRLIALAIIVAACADTTGQETCFDLEELRRVGTDEAADSALDERSIRAGGGVLGNIRGTVPGPDGSMYVLDRHFHKIVRFGPDGAVRQVILGGEGSGPGEFRLPIHITPAEGGFSVLDYELMRVTGFDWDGQLVRTDQVTTPNPWRHVVRGDTAWLTHYSGGPSTGPAWYAVELGSSSFEPGPPLTEEDQAFGTAVGIATSSNGTLIVSTTRPGVWMVHDGDSWLRRGTPLFPTTAPPLEERIDRSLTRTTPSQYSANEIGVVGDSLVIQAIFSYDAPFDWDNPPGRDAGAWSLGIFRISGEHLATVQLPRGVRTTQMYVDRETGLLYLQAADPFPQAIEYALRLCS